MRFAKLEPGKVSAKTQVYSLPYQTDYAEFITGQAFADKEGTVFVEETYDLPVNPNFSAKQLQGVLPPKKELDGSERWGEKPPVITQTEYHEEIEKQEKERKEEEEKFIEAWAEKAHWSLCVFTEVQEKPETPIQAKAEYKVKANEALSFSTYAGAPFWRISFKSESETKEVRIFARAFERGKV